MASLSYPTFDQYGVPSSELERLGEDRTEYSSKFAQAQNLVFQANNIVAEAKEKIESIKDFAAANIQALGCFYRAAELAKAVKGIASKHRCTLILENEKMLEHVIRTSCRDLVKKALAAKQTHLAVEYTELYAQVSARYEDLRRSFTPGSTRS
jgi:hypothetical protein